MGYLTGEIVAGVGTLDVEPEEGYRCANAESEEQTGDEGAASHFPPRRPAAEKWRRVPVPVGLL